MLSRRALSRAEITERLERKGFASAEVAREVLRLARVDLIDDEALARRVCEEALVRGEGRRSLLARLRRRRIPPAVATAALAGVEDVALRLALGRALERAARRYPQWREDRRARERLIRALLARGFDLSAVKTALSNDTDVEAAL